MHDIDPEADKESWLSWPRTVTRMHEYVPQHIIAVFYPPEHELSKQPLGLWDDVTRAAETPL